MHLHAHEITSAYEEIRYEEERRTRAEGLGHA